MEMLICTITYWIGRRRSSLCRRLSMMLTLLISPMAYACPDGYYESCFIGCWCTPNSGTVSSAAGSALNPLPDTLNILGGVVKGDMKQLSQGIGGLVIKSSCPTCAVTGQLLIDKPDREFIERTVGRGWLFYVAGVDPTLIVADAATSVATQYAIKPPSLPVQPPPPPPGRGNKVYTTSIAACIVEGDKKSIIVGWADAPTLKDASTGAESTFPTVDLLRDDVVSVKSDDSCPAVPEGQKKYKEVKMVFNQSSVVEGTLTSMKYFFLGQLYPEASTTTRAGSSRPIQGQVSLESALRR